MSLESIKFVVADECRALLQHLDKIKIFYIVCAWHKSKSIKRKISTNIDPYYDFIKDMPFNSDYKEVVDTLYEFL